MRMNVEMIFLAKLFFSHPDIIQTIELQHHAGTSEIPDFPCKSVGLSDFECGEFTGDTTNLCNNNFILVY